MCPTRAALALAEQMCTCFALTGGRVRRRNPLVRQWHVAPLDDGRRFPVAAGRSQVGVGAWPWLADQDHLDDACAAA